MIDLTPMVNAVRLLGEAIHEQALEPERIIVRAGLIQTFEFNYELAVAMMTRYLESIATIPNNPELKIFESLIRLADEQGLVLSPVATWKGFRQARNNTSHSYNEKKAIAVLAVIPAFEREAKYLLARLQERIGA